MKLAPSHTCWSGTLCTIGKPVTVNDFSTLWEQELFSVTSYFITETPTETAVTNPEEFTVATAALELLQTPLGVALLNCEVVPWQMSVFPEIGEMDGLVGCALIVMVVAVEVQLLALVVVNEYVPEVKELNTPVVLLTAATTGLVPDIV